VLLLLSILQYVGYEEDERMLFCYSATTCLLLMLMLMLLLLLHCSTCGIRQTRTFYCVILVLPHYVTVLNLPLTLLLLLLLLFTLKHVWSLS
jgi:hypothetical protein